MNINAIFEKKGELYFREAEARILRVLRPDSKFIIATGGGMPCFNNNMDYIKNNGISVFLNVPPEKIAERIQRHKANDRPMYQKNDDQLLKNIQQKYKERLPFYEKANVILEGENIHVRHLMEVLTIL